MRLALAFLIPALLFAEVVSFDDALSSVLANNKALKAGKLEVQKAKEMASEATGYNFGRLYLSEQIVRTNHPMHVFGLKLAAREANYGDLGMGEFMSFMNTGSPQVSLETKPDQLNNPKSITGYDTAINYEIPLFVGFKLIKAREAALLQTLAKTHEYDQSEKLLTKELLWAYNGAVAADYFVEAVAKAKEASREYVQISSDLKSAGMATSTDVLQAEQRELEMDAMLIEANNQKELSIAYLRFLTGREELSGVKDFKRLAPINKPLSELQSEAVLNRSDYKAMQANRDTAKAAVAMNRSSYYPTIGAFAKYGVSDTKFSTDTDKDYYMVGVGVSWDLFDGSRGGKIEQSKIEFEQARLATSYMEEGVRLDVEKTYLTLKAKNAVISQKEKAEKLSTEVLEKSRIMYKNGLITMIELLIKEADTLKARAELIKARFDEAQSAAEFYISIGKSLKEQE